MQKESKLLKISNSNVIQLDATEKSNIKGGFEAMMFGCPPPTVQGRI